MRYRQLFVVVSVYFYTFVIPSISEGSPPQYQRGFNQGYQDATEGLKNRYAYKKNDPRKRNRVCFFWIWVYRRY